jgi:hypothetical protein
MSSYWNPFKRTNFRGLSPRTTVRINYSDRNMCWFAYFLDYSFIHKFGLVVVKLTKFLWEVYLIRLHHILPGFWIWPTFQGHRGQCSKKITKLCISLLFDLECSNLVWIPWHPLHLHQISARSHFKYGSLENRCAKSIVVIICLGHIL